MTTLTHGNIADISESGAKFEAVEPPGKGATALLKWGAHEAVCTIIWHDEGACGVWFKQKLPPELVEETAALDRVVEMPIASVGNITQGRKRSLGFLKRAAVTEPDPQPETKLIAVVSEPELEAETVFEDAVDPAPEVSEEPTPPTSEPMVAELELGLCDEAVAEAASAVELVLEPPEDALPPPVPEQSHFGRAAGLPPPTIGHSETLAAVLRRYRATGSWE